MSNMFAKGIYQVPQDNGGSRFDLAEWTSKRSGFG